MERIYDTALSLLENVGVGDATPSILHYALAGGCETDDEGRLRFPRSLVEDALSVTARTYMVHAPEPEFDHEAGNGRSYFSTSGEAVSILDYDTGRYRPSSLVDLYDAARLIDSLEHVHQFGQPFIATEFGDDLYGHDVNAAYAALAGTRKPLALAISRTGHLDAVITLFDAYLGREGAFLARPFCVFGGCPIVSPLRFATESAEVMVKVAELGLPVDVAIAPQAGSTSPAALAGTLAQCFAESLACLAVVNLIRKGNPINFGMWPFVSDLRTGSFTGGSGEQALVMAASAQLCSHFGLISSVACGMTDAKSMDAQAGYEKALGATALALAGGNLVSAYPGAVGSLLGQSFEGMAIDNDMLGCVQRLVRGIEVDDESLSYATIESVVRGPGHYLAHPQTLGRMRSEYLYPEVADRSSPGAWEAAGGPTICERAHAQVRRVLGEHYPERIGPEADARIRARFRITLDPTDMQPGNPRWPSPSH